MLYWKGHLEGQRSSVVEQGTHKPLVAGSSPAAATNKTSFSTKLAQKHKTDSQPVFKKC